MRNMTIEDEVMMLDTDDGIGTAGETDFNVDGEANEVTKKLINANPNDMLGCYLKQIGGFKPLTKEKERELWKNGSPEAIETIVNAHLKMVVALVNKVYPYTRKNDSEFMDLVQMGNIGLLKATKTFDINKNMKFSTHAYYWILGTINSGLAKLRCGQISKPVNVLAAFSTITKAQLKLNDVLGREPTDEEVIVALDGIYPEEKLKELMIKKESQILSLDEPMGHEDDARETLSDTIADLSESSFTKKVEQDELQAALEDELKKSLSPKLYLLICARYGLGEFRENEQTLAEIAELLVVRGFTDKVVTRQRVRQLEAQAIRTLKFHPRFSQMFNQ